MFENGKPTRCLFHLNSEEDSRGYRSSAHSSYICIDLDGNLFYDCNCNRYFDEQNDKFAYHYREPIPLGKLDEFTFPCELTLGVPIPVPEEFDTIVDFGLAGVSRYLRTVFDKRLKYVGDEKWYYWDGSLWIHDVDTKFIVRYLTEEIPNWIMACIDRTHETDKVTMKKLLKLMGRFCDGTQCVRNVLELLRYELEDTTFDDKSRHRGWFAAHNSIVDLKTGASRLYRYDDYVTHRCDFCYDDCDCDPGTCFDAKDCDCDPFDLTGPCHHTCRARDFVDMKWIDDRIKEICGTDLLKYEWYIEKVAGGGVELTKDEGPIDNRLAKADFFWRNSDGKREFANGQSLMCDLCRAEKAAAAEEIRAPVVVCNCSQNFKIVRRTVLAFEDDGLANYKRFKWTVGYILTGLADRKLFVYGYGDQNNGKTLIWNALIDVMRNYLGPMHPSCVFGRTKNDDGATPAMIHVVGKRGGVVGETGKNDILNDHSMKVWAGRDAVVIRKMRNEMYDVKPDLVAVVNANVEPRIDIFDEALWDRFHLLLYPKTYVKAEKRGPYGGHDWELHERPRDESYISEFASPNRQKGLMNWAIRACVYYANTRLCPLPKLVEETMSGFRNINNPIRTYMASATCLYRFDRNESVPIGQFFTHLKEYCKTENIRFKFDQLGLFRKLIQKLERTDNNNRLSVDGIKGVNEMICGISLKEHH
jgi:phage/plasmid-associated DNA primase